MGRPWKTNEIRYLEEKYPHNGTLFCCHALHRTQDAVKMKAYELGLELTEECRSRLSAKVSTRYHTDRVQEALPPVPKGVEQPYRPGDRLAWRARALRYIRACMGPGGGYPEPWTLPGATE